MEQIAHSVPIDNVADRAAFAVIHEQVGRHQMGEILAGGGGFCPQAFGDIARRHARCARFDQEPKGIEARRLAQRRKGEQRALCRQSRLIGRGRRRGVRFVHFHIS